MRVKTATEVGKSLLGCNKLTVWFMSAACPNEVLKNPTFMGQKNEILATVDMCS